MTEAGATIMCARSPIRVVRWARWVISFAESLTGPITAWSGEDRSSGRIIGVDGNVAWTARRSGVPFASDDHAVGKNRDSNAGAHLPHAMSAQRCLWVRDDAQDHV